MPVAYEDLLPVGEEYDEVVVVVLLSPNGRNVCLCLSEGAKNDKKLNLSPLQTTVKVDEKETPRAAAVRCLWEELQLPVTSSIKDLFSKKIKLPSGHHSGQTGRQYHWKCAFADNKNIKAVGEREVSWFSLKYINAQCECMTKTKRAMFSDALQILRNLSGSKEIIYREKICPSKHETA